MNLPAPDHWTPFLLFAFLGIFFLQKAIRPGAKRTWGWGRVGGPVPVSRWGHAAWGFEFLVIAIIVLFGEPVSLTLVFLLVAGFIAIMIAGHSDTRAYLKKKNQIDQK